MLCSFLMNIYSISSIHNPRRYLLAQFGQILFLIFITVCSSTTCLFPRSLAPCSIELRFLGFLFLWIGDWSPRCYSILTGKVRNQIYTGHVDSST